MRFGAGMQRAARWAVSMAAGLAALAAAIPAFAQGCALCYNTASAAKASAIEALRRGILLLLFPPLLIFIAIFVVAYLHRNQFHEAAEAVPAGEGPEDWAAPEFSPSPPAAGEERPVEELARRF